jgi:hypothetical protein
LKGWQALVDDSYTLASEVMKLSAENVVLRRALAAIFNVKGPNRYQIARAIAKKAYHGQKWYSLLNYDKCKE